MKSTFRFLVVGGDLFDDGHYIKVGNEIALPDGVGDNRINDTARFVGNDGLVVLKL